MFVGPFVTRKERLKTQDGEQKFTNVYVKNLDEAVTTEQIKNVFGTLSKCDTYSVHATDTFLSGEFGTITNAAIMIDESGKSKGFGFVNFENAESAKKAVDALTAKDSPHGWLHAKDKTLYVGRAQKKSERENELRAKFEAVRICSSLMFNVHINILFFVAKTGTTQQIPRCEPLRKELGGQRR